MATYFDPLYDPSVAYSLNSSGVLPVGQLDTSGFIGLLVGTLVEAGWTVTATVPSTLIYSPFYSIQFATFNPFEVITGPPVQLSMAACTAAGAIDVRPNILVDGPTIFGITFFPYDPLTTIPPTCTGQGTTAVWYKMGTSPLADSAKFGFPN